LTDEGYTVRSALQATCARAAIAVRRPDLVLLDLHLPDKTGDILVQELKDAGIDNVPIVLMTADARVAKELLIDGIDFCLLKPFDLDELIECVAKHIRKANA
jgi:two-component system nitrogen regulation response regulator NtrX